MTKRLRILLKKPAAGLKAGAEISVLGPDDRLERQADGSLFAFDAEGKRIPNAVDPQRGAAIVEAGAGDLVDDEAEDGKTAKKAAGKGKG